MSFVDRKAINMPSPPKRIWTAKEQRDEAAAEDRRGTFRWRTVVDRRNKKQGIMVF